MNNARRTKGKYERKEQMHKKGKQRMNVTVKKEKKRLYMKRL